MLKTNSKQTIIVKLESKLADEKIEEERQRIQKEFGGNVVILKSGESFQGIITDHI